MRHYETIYIIRPNLSDDECKEVIKKVEGLVEREKGVVVKIEEWGRQRLAYTIKKFDKGVYVLISYCGEAAITAELARELKLDDRVLKFQTVKLADAVDPQELIQREKEARQKETGEVTEAPPAQEREGEPEDSKKEGEVENGVQ